MHFPKFWVLARRGNVSAWGWSDASDSAALANGEARVSRIIERLSRRDKTLIGAYGYPDRPMREEILHEFSSDQKTPFALVSRNSYGCLVLNTTNALFVDVDETPPGAFHFLGALFGKKPPKFEDGVLAKVNLWIDSHSGWGWRVYRTKAGIRLLATHFPVSPEDPLCETIFQEFNADSLYRKLCRNQKCFRARLTPKPWRCGIGNPPHRWPWRTPETKESFKAWEKTYREAAAPYATCRLLGQFGLTDVHPDLSELVTFHDQAVGLATERPLA